MQPICPGIGSWYLKAFSDETDVFPAKSRFTSCRKDRDPILVPNTWTKLLKDTDCHEE
jgi:hypothetical protein